MSETSRPLWQAGLVLLLGLLTVAGLTALGLWQVQRLAWKRDLIAQVDARVHAAPVGLAALTGMPPAELAYRRVRVTGRFDHAAATRVRAVTRLGEGYWLLTPLQTRDGQTVLVNRGFVRPRWHDAAAAVAGIRRTESTVTGLVRISEPDGGFLRRNDPAAERWYSRDVAAIARARGLGDVAPYFIDAEAGPDSGAFPVGGLTVVRFRNAHLVYALTWFSLAAMAAAACLMILRHEWRLRCAPDKAMDWPGGSGCRVAGGGGRVSSGSTGAAGRPPVRVR